MIDFIINYQCSTVTACSSAESSLDGMKLTVGLVTETGNR